MMDLATGPDFWIGLLKIIWSHLTWLHWLVPAASAVLVLFSERIWAQFSPPQKLDTDQA